MATSIIKAPFKGYVIVAASGTATDTYKNKLQSLLSAFNSLSASQKTKSFLFVGSTSIYMIQRISASNVSFGMIPWQSSALVSKMDLVTGARIGYTVSSNGTVDVTDSSDDTTTTNIQLGYWL